MKKKIFLNENNMTHIIAQCIYTIEHSKTPTLYRKNIHRTEKYVMKTNRSTRERQIKITNRVLLFTI